MSPTANMPDRGLLRTILQGVGQQDHVGMQEPTATALDWSVPHHFRRAEIARLEALQAAVAKKMSASLSAMLGTVLTLSGSGLSEQYAGKIAQNAEIGGWVSLADDAKTKCGYLAMSSVSASGWVGRLLGRIPSSKDAVRDLSQLETVLLLDVMTTALSGASIALEPYHLGPLRRSEAVRKGMIENTGGETDEYVRLAFQCEKANGGMSFELYLASDLLLAASGQAAERARPKEEIRKELLAHVEGLTLSGEVILGQSCVAMGDILSLQEGDVLLIDKNASDPLEFVMTGRTLLRGYLCSCEGHYALEVCEKTEVER